MPETELLGYLISCAVRFTAHCGAGCQVRQPQAAAAIVPLGLHPPITFAHDLRNLTHPCCLPSFYYPPPVPPDRTSKQKHLPPAVLRWRRGYGLHMPMKAQQRGEYVLISCFKLGTPKLQLWQPELGYRPLHPPSAEIAAPLRRSLPMFNTMGPSQQHQQGKCVVVGHWKACNNRGRMRQD